MAAEKGLAVFQQAWITGKRPYPPQFFLVVAAEPVADAVAGNSPGGGQQQYGLQPQAARGDNGADAEHDQRAGNN